MDTAYYWQTGDETQFEIVGRKFHLVKRGRELAAQTSALSKWLTTYGALAMSELQSAPVGEEGKADKLDDQIAFLGKALGQVLDPDALIDLGAVVLLCDKAFVEEQFDMGWLVDGIQVIWKYQPGLRFIVEKFAGRFFGRVRPAASAENGSASSTPSALPTDGETPTSTSPSNETGSGGRKRPSS